MVSQSPSNKNATSFQEFTQNTGMECRRHEVHGTRRMPTTSNIERIRPLHIFCRRALLAALIFNLISCVPTCAVSAADPPHIRLSTFSADVTPPLGHRLLTGGGKKATAVDDPLFAKGFVLKIDGEQAVVFASVDWAEIRNDAYDRWRTVLAEAAGTVPQRVLVSSIHQHDAPLADLEAQRILEKHNSDGQIIDRSFHEQAVQNVARALREGLKSARTITELGTGLAEAKQLASNRRFLNPDGSPNYGRYSSGGSPEARTAAEGTIDPNVRTLSFWDGDTPLVALSVYATHPMSYYQTSRISADFPGRARDRRQADEPGTLQIYASGASGNVTVGKYNDGTPEKRPIFADRLYQAMFGAWKSTKRHPLQTFEFRSVPLRLEPRESQGFTVDELKEKVANGADRRTQERAALGLSWRKRVDTGATIDVPVLDFGVAQLLLLPAEIYVEYQLYAQAQRPDSFVVTVGYGECAPGYIPIERAWKEQDQNLDSWCWIAPGAQTRVEAAIRAALKSAP